jgi:DMSO reductase anchor subunit
MLRLALPLSFFLVMLETAIGSYIVLFLLDIYGGMKVARLIEQAKKVLPPGTASSEDAEEKPVEEPSKTLSEAQAARRAGVTKGFLVFQGLLYLILALLTYWFGSVFATPAVFQEFKGFYLQYPLERSWLNYQLIPLLIFMGLLLVYNVLLWANRRLARWVVGSLAGAAGLAELLVIGMAYRPLAAQSLDGAFTVASFFVGALALGGVLTAMLLGHWYLNTPTASGKPLEFATLLMLVGLTLELLFSFFIHTTIPSGLAESGNPPISADVLNVIRFIFGFVFALGLGILAFLLTRGRSFQSATGMLYLAVAFAFTGEIMTRGLFFLPPVH